MSDLKRAISLIKSGRISGQATVFIDEALSKALVRSISADETDSVLGYIDLQLANNPVSQSTRQSLERLYGDLQQRRGGT
ncbi:hypothetical protein [Polaromonas sp. CG_9.11]|uniref:hypothetical protein n=1 Tax=Polaromonas sp. CG_9.11 TaxID=2787730 RepID=UPI0018C93567|nr:hypothetical protein [Polaromonas sp. CG_9.11]MBG6076334.1 hypothetical protein [Polaromonas sp. CG_9.11]